TRAPDRLGSSMTDDPALDELRDAITRLLVGHDEVDVGTSRNARPHSALDPRRHAVAGRAGTSNTARRLERIAFGGVLGEELAERLRDFGLLHVQVLVLV